jgi:hypothetical protein
MAQFIVILFTTPNKVNNITNIFLGLYILGQRDYMFRPVEAIIRFCHSRLLRVFYIIKWRRV